MLQIFECSSKQFQISFEDTQLYKNILWKGYLSLAEGLQKFLADELDDVDRLSTQLPESILIHISSFLSMRELGVFRGTNRMIKQVLDPTSHNAHVVWGKHWKPWCESGKVNFVNFLSQKLRHERDELAHWRKILHLSTSVKEIGAGLVDISGNIGKFPSQRIAQAVSRRRPAALLGVMVNSIEAVHVGNRIQRRTSSPFNRSVSFMLTNTPTDTVAPRPPIEAKGFVGYALDLLELRPNEEYLRETVFSSLVYRDLTVWETLEDMLTAIRNGEYRTDNPFYCIVDDERLNHLVMDDDAPRNPQGIVRNNRQLEHVCAPWKTFRPRIQDINSPKMYVNLIEDRINALSNTLLNATI